jgi:cytosine/adenosine deaminase-related metal-dependent hydrolase
MAAATRLAGATLDDGRRVDVHLAEGRIAAIEPAGSASAGEEVVDLAGRLLCPAFVDGHIHLDKTLLGLDWLPHLPGSSVAERIAAEKRLRSGLALPLAARASRLIEQVVGFGTTRLRCHVDVDPAIRLAGLHTLLELRERYRALIDIQLVAFPQSGILAAPGTADLLDAAIAEGADLVGGLDPAGIDGDIAGHLDVVFAIAQRRGVGVDIHLHDFGLLGSFELRQIATRTIAAGLQGRVAVSHAFALGMIDEEEFAGTADALAAAGVAIMTNGPGPVAMPPVKRLAARGVVVFAGSDNIRDAWSPYGNGDMLERAMLIGWRGGLLADEDLRLAFAMATSLAAQATGAPDHRLEPGTAADLVALDAPHVPAAVVGRPAARLVFKQGRLVARDGRLA